MKIVILGNVQMTDIDRARLEKIATVATVPSQKDWSDADLIEKIGDADIVINFLVPMSSKVLSSLKNTKLIVLATTGFNDIDLDAARLSGITVCHVPGYATDSVAEHTLGLMLAASRLSFQSSLDLHNEIYDPTQYTGTTLTGKKLGIIGWGKIGSKVGAIAKKGFGMMVVYVDKSGRDDLEKLLQVCDIISVHAPLNEETRHMIGAKEFALMKDGVVIINTARAGIIDENALLENLQSKKVFAAGLDVISDKSSKLLALPNVVATPHIAFNTKEALNERSNIIVGNIEKFLEGEPQNVVCIP